MFFSQDVNVRTYIKRTEKHVFLFIMRTRNSDQKRNPTEKLGKKS